MISPERDEVYKMGKLLKMTSDIFTDPEQMIANLTLIMVYNAFSSPKDRISDSSFCKSRCKPKMKLDQITEATKRSEVFIERIRDIENTSKAQLPQILDLDYKRIAGVIRDKHHVISFGGKLYRYKDGVYVEDRDKQIDSEIVNELSRCDKFDGDDDVTRAAHQVKHYLTYEKVESEYPFNSKKGAFNVANGIIKLDMVTGEHELIPHSPEYRFNYKLKVSYDKDAPIDEMAQYFKTLESDTNKISSFLSQIPAHALLSMDGFVYKRAYFCKGEHDSGKSTYIEMLVRRFFGENVCSSVSLQELLYDRFRLAELDGKLLNVYADLASSKIKNVGIFKALTGGDHVTIERKHQDPYKFVNRAVLLFSGNTYPKMDVQDDESAFWIRWIPLEFKNTFKVDPEFSDKKFTDKNMSGFLNMVLMAIPGIIAEGIKENGNIMSEWLKDSNSAHEFIEVTLEKCPGAVLIKSPLYQKYVEYCNNNEMAVEDMKIFTRTMRSAGYIVDSRHKLRGYQQHCYTDVKEKGSDFALYPDGYSDKKQTQQPVSTT